MSIKAMSYVWETEIPTAAQKLMLLAIADRCDDEGVCFPGIKHLAKKCDVTERTASKTLSKLEEIGELVIAIKDGIKTSGGPTNRYYMKGYRSSIGLETTAIGTRSDQLESTTEWEKPCSKDKETLSNTTGDEVSNLTGNELSNTTGDEVSNLTDDSSVDSSVNSSVDSLKDISSLRETDVFLWAAIYSGLLKPKPDVVVLAENHLDSLPESDLADAIEEIPDELPEHESDNPAKELNDRYTEVVRRAFGTPGKPLNYGGVVGNHVKTFRGLWVEGEKGAGSERLEYQFKENPPTPAEIIGMALWYRPTYRQDKLPASLKTLRERFDEFRATYDYANYVAEGESRLEAIMGNTETESLEEKTTRFDNTKAPTRANYAPPSGIKDEDFDEEAIGEFLKELS